MLFKFLCKTSHQYVRKLDRSNLKKNYCVLILAWKSHIKSCTIGQLVNCWPMVQHGAMVEHGAIFKEQYGSTWFNMQGAIWFNFFQLATIWCFMLHYGVTWYSNIVQIATWRNMEKQGSSILLLTLYNKVQYGRTWRNLLQYLCIISSEVNLPLSLVMGHLILLEPFLHLIHVILKLECLCYSDSKDSVF